MEICRLAGAIPVDQRVQEIGGRMNFKRKHLLRRYTPYREVCRILLARFLAQLSVKGFELVGQPRQPSVDKSYAQAFRNSAISDSWQP